MWWHSLSAILVVGQHCTEVSGPVASSHAAVFFALHTIELCIDAVRKAEVVRAQKYPLYHVLGFLPAAQETGNSRSVHFKRCWGRVGELGGRSFCHQARRIDVFPDTLSPPPSSTMYLPFLTYNLSFSTFKQALVNIVSHLICFVVVLVALSQRQGSN